MTNYPAPEVTGSATSYFSRPGGSLDPNLFDGLHLKGFIRNGLLTLLIHHLMDNYMGPEYWAVAWLAGSGVSFQWEAARDPGDLDVLVGVDYVEFRRANPGYSGMSDTEISRMITSGFREHLQPNTTNWNGYEVTFYVNPHATDIRVINPYAAYDLTHDEWTVTPTAQMAPRNRSWEEAARRDHERAVDAVTRYSKALTEVQNATNPAARRNAEGRLNMALDMASSLFDEIHEGRRLAFSSTGGGYGDYYNYRWQAGKQTGAVEAARQLKEFRDTSRASKEAETYGVELPDVQTLIRRAAEHRARG